MDRELTVQGGERWRRLEDIFHAAVELGGSEREGFVQTSCGSDYLLREEIESLLLAHDTADEFLRPTPPRLPPPIEFLGNQRFRVDARLGEGGFGIVYKAFDQRRRSHVALKLLREPDGEGIYRFKREFRSLAGVFHPNLVELHELFSEEGRWFLTMELVEGVTFVKHIRAAGPEQVSARLHGVLPQLVNGLLALHRAGRLHRDLKPPNVLVDRQGHVKILDFGLVTELFDRRRGHTAQLVGTPAYMAPEVISGQAGEASDWYGVGAMVYEAVAGEPPFTGELSQVLASKTESEPGPPSSGRPDSPSEWDELCGELLRRDPSARPGGASILSRLGARAALASTPPLARGDLEVFVGREEELCALHDAYERSQAGQLAVLELRGTSGIGKSTLVRRFLDDLRSAPGSDAVVVSGRCYEQESVPYKAVDSLMDELSRHLRGLPLEEADAVLPRDVQALLRLFPVLGRVPAIITARRRSRLEGDLLELRRKGFAALRELLIRISERSPLVLWLDDLQWGDADSLALLREILRPPDPPALLLITCVRAQESAEQFELSWTAALAELGGGVRLELGELSPLQACSLAETLLGPQADAAAAVAEESGGNPMLVRLLSRQMTRSGARSLNVQNALAGEWADQGEEAQLVLQALAVSGQPLPLDALQRLGSVAADRRAALETLRREGLVRFRDRAGACFVEICHDRVGAAIAASMNAEARSAEQRRLAETLEGLDPYDPEMVANLYAAGEEPSRAARHAVVAAEQASQALAFDRAVRLYQLAFQTHPDPAEAAQLQRALAGALANAGRGRESAAAYLALASGGQGPYATELRRNAADQLLRAGHVDEGMDVLRVVLKAVGMRLPRTTTGASLSFLAQSVWLNVRGFAFGARRELPPDDALRLATCAAVSEGLAWIDTARAATFTARFTRLALKAGDPFRVGRGLAALAAFWGFAGVRREWSRRALRLALALGRRLREPQVLHLSRLAAGVMAYGQGHFRECERHCARALALYEKAGSKGWEHSSAEILSFSSNMYLGRLAAPRQRLSAMLEDAEARGDLFIKTHLLTRQSVMAQLAADDPESASEGVSRAMSAWSHKGFHLQHYWELSARIEIALYAGQAPRVWSEVLGTWRALESSAILGSPILRIEMHCLRGRLALAAWPLLGSEGARLAAADAGVIESRQADWARPLVWLLRASIAASRGDANGAVPLLRKAERGFSTDGLAIFAAVCRRRLGQLSGGPEGAGRVEEADDLLRQQGIRRPDRIADLYAPWGPT